MSLNSPNWYLKSISREQGFMDIMNCKQVSVIDQVNSRTYKETETNSKKLRPII